jgi:ABC-type tungstate transport system substrate-binding protein
LVNRMQSLVLGFFAVAWLSLVAILLVEPEIYDAAMKLPAGRHRLADLAFLGAISALIGLLVVGVSRRWRWTFWLILVAFLIGGALRIPASVLELAGLLSPAGPTWYVLFQALLGLVQVTIGLLLLSGYRRTGPWGEF